MRVCSRNRQTGIYSHKKCVEIISLGSVAEHMLLNLMPVGALWSSCLVNNNGEAQARFLSCVAPLVVAPLAFGSQPPQLNASGRKKKTYTAKKKSKVFSPSTETNNLPQNRLGRYRVPWCLIGITEIPAIFSSGWGVLAVYGGTSCSSVSAHPTFPHTSLCNTTG